MVFLWLEFCIKALYAASQVDFKFDLESITRSMFHRYVEMLSVFADHKILDKAFWRSNSQFASVFPLRAVSKGTIFTTAYSQSATRAFKVQYQRADLVPKALIDFANRCLHAWDHQIYYSLYAAVVNASMIGKSRAFEQLASLGVFVFTISFQSVYSANLPTRSVIVADWFASKDFDGDHETCKAFYAAFLVACLEKLVAFIDANEGLTLRVAAETWAAKQTVNHADKRSKKIATSFWSEIIDAATRYRGVTGVSE